MFQSLLRGLRGKITRPAPSPDLVKEIHVDAESATFTLLGDDWQWMEDQECSYVCGVCDAPENVKLRSYKHLPSGKLMVLLLHSCQGKKAVHTEEIQVSGGLR